jgi:hypothetical protein
MATMEWPSKRSGKRRRPHSHAVDATVRRVRGVLSSSSCNCVIRPAICTVTGVSRGVVHVELDGKKLPIGESHIMSGRDTLKVEPAPLPRLLALTVPPCNSTSCLTIDKPSPSPPCALGVEASA